jgi:hypothetical protein
VERPKLRSRARLGRVTHPGRVICAAVRAFLDRPRCRSLTFDRAGRSDGITAPSPTSREEGLLGRPRRAARRRVSRLKPTEWFSHCRCASPAAIIQQVGARTKSNAKRICGDSRGRGRGAYWLFVVAGHAGGNGDQRQRTTGGDGDNAERGPGSSAAKCTGDFPPATATTPAAPQNTPPAQ